MYASLISFCAAALPVKCLFIWIIRCCGGDAEDSRNPAARKLPLDMVDILFEGKIYCLPLQFSKILKGIEDSVKRGG